MDSRLFSAIDLYCERTGPELWSEPVNALTNLAFVLAGLWGLAAIRRHRVGVFAEALAWWVVAIGIGSFLFHTFANHLTIWADILPIATFTLAFTIFTLRNFLGLGWGPTLVAFVAFYAFAGLATFLVPEAVRVATNGSSGYLPALLALLVFGIAVSVHGSPAGRYILAAAGVFVVSVTCRAIDLEVCGSFPIGSHFLWHVFNGVMLAILLAAVARHGRPAASN